MGRHRVIYRNLLLPCNDLPFEVPKDKICRKAKRVLKRGKSPTTPPDQSPENSSDDEPDGILTFSPVQDREMTESQSPQVSPANARRYQYLLLNQGPIYHNYCLQISYM